MLTDTHQPWFKEAKFGLFIHFGLYSQLAGEYNGRTTRGIGEWIMNSLDIPVEEYRKLAATFDPVNFDADAIAARAKGWGMKYLVFTAKHHEGFALYDSACNRYNSVKASPCHRDFVAELQAACRKYGLKFGLYYSQAQDWDDPDGYRANHDNTGKNYRRYLDEKCLPQLRELLTNYPDVSLIWFDTPMGTTPEESREMVELVKSIRPECVISGRIGNGLGDYMTTCDNFIPVEPFDGDWEVPATLNDTWGFKKSDHEWKDPHKIIRLLTKINSRGGNYLLNIGPDGTGKVPDRSYEILDEVGGYVSRNAEAIFATHAVPVYPYEVDWGVFTHKGNTLYLHVLEPQKAIDLTNIANQLVGAYVVETGEKLESEMQYSCEGYHCIHVSLPEAYQKKSYYCIAMEFEETELLFEPIRP